MTACGLNPAASLPTAVAPVVAVTARLSVIPAVTAHFTEKPTGQPVQVMHTPTPAGCQVKTGSLEKGAIETPLIDKPMRYTVYLPPCYSFFGSKKYPVLYLLHGQGFAEDQWIRIGAAAAADELISTGKSPAFIMVLPYDYSYKQPTEYKFEEVFTRLLIPTIDQAYRTIPQADRRAIGGLSRGGAWALHIGMRNPGMFGTIGGHSPAIFFADEQSLPRRVLEIPSDRMPRIWLDVGMNDSEYIVIQAFEVFLNKNNVSHIWHEYIGWHDEKYWSAHVHNYLSWYAQAWK